MNLPDQRRTPKGFPHHPFAGVGIEVADRGTPLGVRRWERLDFHLTGGFVPQPPATHGLALRAVASTCFFKAVTASCPFSCLHPRPGASIGTGLSPATLHPTFAAIPSLAEDDFGGHHGEIRRQGGDEHAAGCTGAVAVEEELAVGAVVDEAVIGIDGSQ